MVWPGLQCRRILLNPAGTQSWSGGAITMASKAKSAAALSNYNSHSNSGCTLFQHRYRLPRGTTPVSRTPPLNVASLNLLFGPARYFGLSARFPGGSNTSHSNQVHLEMNHDVFAPPLAICVQRFSLCVGRRI